MAPRAAGVWQEPGGRTANRAAVTGRTVPRARPWRALLAAVALLVAVLPGRVADATLRRTLTITGTRTAYTELTVTEETVYHLTWYKGTTMEYAGGRWGGFAIGADWPHVESVWDPQFATIEGRPAHRAKDVPGLAGILSPGKHRVYLFTDGQRVTVRIRWTGPDLTLEPATALDAKISADTTVLAYGGGTLALPQDGGPGTVTAAAVHWQETGPHSHFRIRACYARRPESWATCDRGLGTVTLYSDHADPVAAGVIALDGVPRRQDTAGRTYFVEATGAATGVLTALTLRYRPAASDLRKYPVI